jgi:oligo-1,6-glucosidase
VQEAHKRNIKIIMDFVGDYTSDEHKWFQEASKSRDNPYHNYYVWHEPVNGGVPNDWVSFFGGSAWELNTATGEYYLHHFTSKQPNLNWANPAVRREIVKMLQFWIDKGVSGFRCDAITLVSPDPTFANANGKRYDYVYANGKYMHDYLRELNREVFSKNDVMTVGEAVGIPAEEAPLSVSPDRHELDMIFQFDQWSLDRAPMDKYLGVPWKLEEFKAMFDRWDRIMEGRGWNSIYLGNHDVPRIVSRYGNDTVFRRQTATMLATFLLTMRGTPYIYNGDEIGMTNVPFKSFDDYRDVEAINYVRDLRKEGVADPEILRRLNGYSRDNARTPMQWDDSLHAGFSSGRETWIPVNPNYPDINVAKAEGDPNSILSYYKQLIRLRKTTPTLVYGAYADLSPQDPNLFVYIRGSKAERLLIVLNFKSEESDFTLPAELAKASRRLLIGNYPATEASGLALHLKPYEARVYAIPTPGE